MTVSDNDNNNRPGSQPIDKSAYPLLGNIDSPADLRKLSVGQLPALCEEIRRFLIANLSSNPGHFASSMGAVEIIVATHYVFDTPHDKVVYDVGHQAYAHKLLTGRRDSFCTQRTKGGLSGFPSPAESPYDTFTCGHASNSISAALGMAIASNLSDEEKKSRTVAIIGDASISGGLAFEGLNNTSNNPNDLLIILNDNEMSIDDNVGALHRYLSDLTTSSRYNRIRYKLYNFFRSKGVIDEKDKSRWIRFNNSLKAFISRQQNIFEGLNIRYFGPIDGNDVMKLVKVLQEIRDMKGPRLLHLHTVKGKGFPVAEKDPTTWHAPGKFDPVTGERLANSGKRLRKWQDVFGETIVELAGKNPEIVGVTAAMPTGTSMCRMLKAYPDRTFDVGISEGHAVTFAGGLAASGKRPFVAIYSSFLQRAYDNIIHDVAIQHLPVTLCIDRAGIVGEDGVTHHGLFDLSYLGCIPGIKIASPADSATLRNLMLTSLSQEGPMAIRYPRGNAADSDADIPMPEMKVLEIGKGRKVYEAEGAEGANVAILTLGPILSEAQKAVEVLKEEGIKADIYDMIWLKPLDTTLLEEIGKRYRYVVTVEDGILNGGFGQTVGMALANAGSSAKTVNLGIGDRWVYHATPAQLYAECGIDAASIADTIRKL